jgi:hypothetical protein
MVFFGETDVAMIAKPKTRTCRPGGGRDNDGFVLHPSKTSAYNSVSQRDTGRLQEVVIAKRYTLSPQAAALAIITSRNVISFVHMRNLQRFLSNATYN